MNYNSLAHPLPLNRDTNYANYGDFMNWRDVALANFSLTPALDECSLLDLYNTYINTNVFSDLDEKLLRAYLRSRIEIDFAANMRDVAAAFGGTTAKV